MLAALLHALALLVALNVQSMESPLAGAWLLFHTSGCICSYRENKDKDLLWLASVIWLIFIAVSAFILRPVVNGATTMWILAALPMLALSVNKDNIKYYLKAFGGIIFIYTLALIIQMVLRVRYTTFEYYVPFRDSYAVSWPLLDPNNAALVLNCGLIPCFYMALRKPKYWVVFGYFVLAMLATASRAGALAGGIGCLILAFERFGADIGLFFSMFFAAPAIPMIWKSVQNTLATRIELWKACFKLLFMKPFTGLGLGTFAYYYQQVRTEHNTGGWFAHNDFIQLGIEMGFPAVATLAFLILCVAFKTTRSNIVSGCVLLAIVLQACLEFQLYVPPISLIGGLALAYHMHNSQKPILALKHVGYKIESHRGSYA